MEARPRASAHCASACAFVPAMSERNPPSQTTVGPAPVILRHARRSPSSRSRNPAVSPMALPLSLRIPLRHPVSAYAKGVALPPDFTLLQVVPELDTGGAEQTTLDVARAVIGAGGKALVATRGGRMTARLVSDGGRLAE